MEPFIVAAVGFALSVVAVFLPVEMARAHNPSCPADWPDIDMNAAVINELRHTDGHGDQWVVFGNPLVVRAYPVDERYAQGYAPARPTSPATDTRRTTSRFTFLKKNRTRHRPLRRDNPLSDRPRSKARS